MKFIKLDLLTLLIGLFLFASCKSSNTIGLDVDPATAIQGTLVDSVTVDTKTVTDEPASTAALLRYPLGFLNDPILGTTEASLAMSVNLPSNKYTFGTNPTIDSAVLVLPYSTEFYGDSTSTYSVDVHQLTTDISEQTSFKSDHEWAYDATTLAGNYTGIIKPNTPLKITNVVTGKADTLGKVSAQMRIKLDPEFVRNTILKDTSILKNNAFFTAGFKGLHVSINKEKTTGTGGIAFFSMAGADSKLEIYYKKQNATTSTARDTVEVNFPIKSTSNPVAATVKHSYSTDVSTQLANPAVKYPVTYLQGLTGLRNKISFPHLASFIKNLGGKIVINKAELVIDVSSGTDVSPFVPAPRLALYTYDIAGVRANIKDNINPASSLYGGFYNTTNKNYKFIVTSYLQQLIDGTAIDYGTYLSTSASTEFDLTPPITSASRSVIGSYGNPTNKVKLNIYYTKIN
ncbi:MAG: hypothetical protein JWQ28_2023 [Pedobacter sp.]|nr:hypothetical protein [Pedobacter sp.]